MTALTERAAMAAPDLVPSGEARAKAKARRFALVFGGVGLIAGVAGFLVGFGGGVDAARAGQPWPA